MVNFKIAVLILTQCICRNVLLYLLAFTCSFLCLCLFFMYSIRIYVQIYMYVYGTCQRCGINRDARSLVGNFNYVKFNQTRNTLVLRVLFAGLSITNDIVLWYFIQNQDFTCNILTNLPLVSLNLIYLLTIKKNKGRKKAKKSNFFFCN